MTAQIIDLQEWRKVHQQVVVDPFTAALTVMLTLAFVFYSPFIIQGK